MTRRTSASKTAVLALALAALGLAATACNKPSKAQCEKAIDNVRRIAGTETDDFGTDRRDMIRSCRGNATRKSVACMANAKGAVELEKCEGGIYGKLFHDDGGVGDSAKKPDTKTATPGAP